VGTPVRDKGYKARRPARHGPDGDPGGTLSEETTGATAGRGGRRPYPKRAETQGRRRLSGPVVISIILHVVVGIALLRILLVPYPFTSLFASKEKPVEPERISFLALPQASATTSPGKSGGNGRTETPTKRETPRPLVAPTEVPSTLPPVTPAAPPPATDDEANGPLIGRGGATRGIRPSYSDPRIWVPPAPVVSAPKSAHQRMDSVVTADIEHARDSAAAVAYSPNKFERGDWTVEKNGKKYGIDGSKIYLGKFWIPSAVLAALPIRVQNNPGETIADRLSVTRRSDVLLHAESQFHDDEFKSAVKRIRERKDRERREKKQQEEQGRGVAEGSGPTP